MPTKQGSKSGKAGKIVKQAYPAPQSKKGSNTVGSGKPKQRPPHAY